MISLDRCGGSCNTLDDLLRRICVPKKNKTEYVNLNVFNKITGINESKAIKKNTFHVTVGVNLIEEK